MPLRLYQRKGSPFWWIAGTIDGRRIRESTGIGHEGTANRRLAEQKCAARETALHREAIHGTPAARRSFASVAASYLEHAGPHTDDTRAKVARLLIFFGPGMAADDVDQEAVDRACAGLLRPGPSPATRLRQVISPVRAILTHGAKRRMCVMPAFDTGKASPSRTEWLSPAEVDRLLAAAAPHLRPLIAFLAGTGARLGEALALEWKDVDLKHARVTLRDTKNGGDRIVDLCPRVIAGLRFDPREKARRGALRMLAGRVFLTRAGRPYAKRKVQGGGQISTGWAAAVKRAGITKPITPHGLRHTWATWHYAEHRDLLRLRFDGDWSTVQLVERYAHLAPPTIAAEIVDWRAAGTVLAQDGAAGCKEVTRTIA